MSASTEELKRQIETDGFAVVANLYDPTWIAKRINEVNDAFCHNTNDAGIGQRGGVVYAARNVLDLIPSWQSCWQVPQVASLLQEILGNTCGLVRGLYFDKPPKQTWALPWHKDLSIAIAHNETVPAGYSTPRLKAGVWHTEPPVEVLQNMLTLRIHLDDVTSENGPLEVLPGSHLTGKELQIEQFQPETILLNKGDVLVMRPLLAHASGASSTGTQKHRRVIHLEFTGFQELPGGVNWHRYSES